MPRHEEPEVYLRSIAVSLEGIERILAQAFPPPQEHINNMAVPTGPVTVGGTDTFTSTFVDANGGTVSQPIAQSSSDPSVVSVSDDGQPGVSVATLSYLAAGTATITSSAVNSDGSTVDTGSNNPFTITVVAAADLGVAVNNV